MNIFIQEKQEKVIERGGDNFTMTWKVQEWLSLGVYVWQGGRGETSEGSVCMWVSKTEREKEW